VPSAFRRVGHRSLATGAFLSLEQWEIEAPDGRRAVRDFVAHPGAVAFVALDGDQMLLIKQYRAALDDDLLEIPAGKLDKPGEDLTEAVRRECREELGCEPSTIQSIGSFHVSPGFTDEHIHLFVVDGLRPAGNEPDGLEEEYAEVVKLTRQEVTDLIRAGGITDAKTLVAIGRLAWVQ